MKARLPYQYQQGKAGERKRTIAAAILLFSRALHEYGFSANKINTWLCYLSESLEEISGSYGTGYTNKTWGDEIEYWAEKNGLDIPNEYRLTIRGAFVSAGAELRWLLFCELYALTYMGYGEKRLQRILEAYGAISGLYTDGKAKYSKAELEKWADETGVER